MNGAPGGGILQTDVLRREMWDVLALLRLDVSFEQPSQVSPAMKHTNHENPFIVDKVVDTNGRKSFDCPRPQSL